jgi:hypothetical protein
MIREAFKKIYTSSEIDFQVSQTAVGFNGRLILDLLGKQPAAHRLQLFEVFQGLV